MPVHFNAIAIGRWDAPTTLTVAVVAKVCSANNNAQNMKTTARNVGNLQPHPK